jgi:hypothetical protein
VTDPRAVKGAQNNGDWYAMMFDVHQRRYERSDLVFTAVDVPPPFHSGMVVLTPGRSEAVSNLIPSRADQPRFGIKDSFNELDFAMVDLVELFSASWIWCDTPPDADLDGWEAIDSVDRLLQWEAAWKEGGSPTDERQFPDAILERADVGLFGRVAGSGYDAGVIANRSADVVGLSNAFGPADAYPAAAALCGRFGDGLPVVGYEQGEDLDVALAAGFEATGELRVAYRPAEG